MPSLSIICFCLLTLFTFASQLFVSAQFEIKMISDSTDSSPFIIAQSTSQLVKPAAVMIFYVEVALGTPPFLTKVAFDTTNPMSWVQTPQCKECVPVHQTSMFNPRNSTSFRALRSTDPLCVAPYATPTDRFCNYDLGYSRGFLARDHLGLASVASSSPSSFVFGCGLYNPTLIGGTRSDNSISGILGLATGHPASMMSQLHSTILGKFSYCLPAHFHRVNNSSGLPTLDFGRRAALTGKGIQTTPLLKNQYNMFTVNVTGISLNGKLVVDLIKLARAPFGEGTTIFVLDSVFPGTMMRGQIFDGLRLAVVNYFKVRYGWFPLEQSLSGWFLCYPLGAGDVIYPTITLHMQDGANFELMRIFQKISGIEELCMTIIPVNSTYYNDIANNLGTPQQLTYRFWYDLAASKFSFAPNRC